MASRQVSGVGGLPRVAGARRPGCPGVGRLGADEGAGRSPCHRQPRPCL